MSNGINKFMAINTDNGQAENIMGKYMYYSLPNMVVKVDSVKSVCEQIGFPIEVNEKFQLPMHTEVQREKFMTASKSL